MNAMLLLELVLLRGYELLTVMLPFIVLFLLLNSRYKSKGLHDARGRFFALFVFMFYLFAVFQVTGAGTLFDFWRYGIDLNPSQINLEPFAYFVFETHFLNIVLFIPLGFLLPLIWPNKAKIGWAFMYGLGFSVLIEMSQLLNNRQSDVDDLLMNTAGALLGYVLFKLFALITRRKDTRADYYKCEPFLYIAVLFLGHFFFFNEFGFARILYGF